jgi:hypothetical protein
MLPFLRTGEDVFDPEDVAAMATALDDVCKILNLHKELWPHWYYAAIVARAVSRGRCEVRENEPYEQYAEDCRKLAATMKDPKHKKQLEEMADAWMFVANECKQRSRKIQAETH